MAGVSKRPRGNADIDSSKTKKPKTSKKNSQIAQLEDVADSEEDSGRSTSTKFLAVAKESRKRSNPAVTNHIQAVEREKRKLSTLLDEEVLRIKSRNAELQATLTNILTQSRQGNPEKDGQPSTAPANDTPHGHTIYQYGISAISSSRELLAQYNRICEQVASREEALKEATSRKDDSEALSMVLQKQGEKVKLELDHLLNRKSKDSTESTSDDLLTPHTEMWNHYAGASTKQGAAAVAGPGWAVVAKHAKKAVDLMVRDLPDESE